MRQLYDMNMQCRNVHVYVLRSAVLRSDSFLDLNFHFQKETNAPANNVRSLLHVVIVLNHLHVSTMCTLAEV